ncbi:hypothetical protein Tco_0979979 [Tanacetum coccineum]
MSPENKAYFESERKRIHLILTGNEMKYTQLFDARCEESSKNCGKLLKGNNKGIRNIQDSRKNFIFATSAKVNVIFLSTTFNRMSKEQYDAAYNVFANERQHSEQPESNDKMLYVECDDERIALANLIANLKLDVDENKKIQKKLKKANTTLAHELTECKSILAETTRTLRESNSIRDSCLLALQNKQTEFERYKNLNDRTVDYEKLEHKLNETLGLLAQRDIDIKEGLKLKAYEISIVQEKHDELVKQSFF